MKKKLKGIFLITFIATLLILSYLIVSQIKHKKEIEKNIKNIPKFSFQNINGGIFTNQNLKKQTATIFIYFNTECEFCNEEAKMIKENMESLRDFQLIFVSFEKTETIKTFAQKYQLTTYDNIYFLSDNKVTFASTFDVKSLPSLVLYNKKQKLIEKIKGQTQIEVLIKK
ncbi:peroxiredoxin [Flavobacterium sp. ov086]|uniref:peroxiredoxin family protein n=1 Tax=Flavobacterium sp. ov086 TaxID=1761785 RepID=UPI000B644A48|nr:redoxin domain-containing protein [Flavobacterium sp. ov086]SNR39410.1 AhpC/TSA family protein [Flavobacterium sp. ov086]